MERQHKLNLIALAVSLEKNAQFLKELRRRWNVDGEEGLASAATDIIDGLESAVASIDKIT